MLHASDGHVVVRAVLVPRLWQLALGRHSRIFTKMKVPDIIKAILEENGVTDHEFRLGTYEVEEHVCQYRESDLDFISRWMEREGIFYFFEHGDDGERLILTDHRAYDDDELGLPVRYFPQFGSDVSKGMRFRSFTCRHTTLPASVRLKDYDYAKPNLNVSGTAKVADNGTGEVNLYGERFFSPSAGDRLAKIRAEEMLARQAIYHAAGNRTHLRAGYTFEVDEHPFPSFNTRYLAHAVHHTANQANGHPAVRAMLQMEGGDDVYSVEVDAMPAKLQFRAESLTAWPRIYGYENGIVDGPADSEYAQIDEQGRYNAKFKFDESTLKGGKATTWVRMMQPHGGDIEGFHFPLRKGTEVVFSYLGGDPDRPVISGVVPNMLHPSPVTSANHTKNVIQTGARNRIEIEDKAGNEWVRLSTPYATSFLNMGLAYPSHEVTLSTQQNMGFGAMAALDIGVGNGIPGPSGGGNMTVHVLNNLTTIVDNVDMKTTVSSGNAFHTVSLRDVHGARAEQGHGDVQHRPRVDGQRGAAQVDLQRRAADDRERRPHGGDVQRRPQDHRPRGAGAHGHRRAEDHHQRRANDWRHRRPDDHHRDEQGGDDCERVQAHRRRLRGPDDVRGPTRRSRATPTSSSPPARRPRSTRAPISRGSSGSTPASSPAQ